MAIRARRGKVVEGPDYRKDFSVDRARVVEMHDDVTHIGDVDDGSREVVSRGLATLGELLRSNQLTRDDGS
jgi:hypothetical protein